ncbi:MAG: VOC family protein [Polyangiales bacterium]
MTTHKQIYLNLPVKDLERSIAFFETLGYAFNPQFRDQNGAAMIINEDVGVMLLAERFFETLTPKSRADAKVANEVLVTVSHDSKASVDALVEAAVAAGGRTLDAPKDHGFMYQWGFEDLDGHIWGHIWMAPSGAPG